MSSYALHDYRREQLGLEKEPTHSQTVHNGVTATRIDRFYIPTTRKYEDTLWNIEIREQFVWGREPSDHKPLLLHIEAIKGERGHSRSTIKEELVFDPKIQSKIKEIVIECYRQTASESRKWERSMAALRDYLLSETRARQKKDSFEMIQIKNSLEISRKHEAKNGPSPQTLAHQKQLKTRLFELECPEAQGLATKAAAIRMTERSDTCTKAYFRTFNQGTGKTAMDKQNQDSPMDGWQRTDMDRN